MNRMDQLNTRANHSACEYRDGQPSPDFKKSESVGKCSGPLRASFLIYKMKIILKSGSGEDLRGPGSLEQGIIRMSYWKGLGKSASPVRLAGGLSVLLLSAPRSTDGHPPQSWCHKVLILIRFKETKVCPPPSAVKDIINTTLTVFH